MRGTQALGGQIWRVAGLWMLAFTLCLFGWALLSNTEASRREQRIQIAGQVASQELAGLLTRSDVPSLGPQMRALLVHRDIGFAWLRALDARDNTVASAGRLESGVAAKLPSGLRRQLYALISSEHREPLLYNGAEVGALEFGLLLGGGGLVGTGGRLLTGLLLLGLGLPALLLLSLRLRNVFLADWSASGPATVREATLSVQDTAVRPPPDPARPAGVTIPAGAETLLKVFDRGAIAIDRHQAVIELNPLAAELTGWTQEQARGRPLSEVLRLYNTDLQRPAKLSLEDCFSGLRERIQAHYSLRDRNEALHEVDLDAGPLRDSTGYIAGVLLSISKTAKSSGMLQRIVPGQAPLSPQARQQLSQMLLDQVLECVITTDSQDRIQFANGRALQAFGYSLPELRGEHISRLLPVPFLRKSQLRVADFALTLPGMPDAQVTAQRRDGSQVAATLVVQPVDFRGRQGHVVTVRPVRIRAATGTGVTLGPRLRHLLGSLPDEAYVIEPESLRLLAENPAAIENLGFSAEELGQMTLLRLSPRLSPDTLRNHISRLREGETDIVELRSWHRRADGSSYEVNARLSLWRGEGTTVLLLVAKAIDTVAARPDTAFREDKVGFLATHDALTSLSSPQLLMQRLQQAIEHHAEGTGPFAVVHIALSGFDEVNEAHGYEAGDRLLKAVADRLSVAVRTADYVARLGGDEFALLMGGIRRREDMAGLFRRLQQALSPPLQIGQHRHRIQACMGAAVFPGDAGTAEALLRHAGQALQVARARGPEQTALYRASASPEAAGDIEPALQLREAQTCGRLGIELQALHDVRARQVIGAEALMAWYDPEHGVLRTAEQVRQAGNRADLADALGLWILEQACEQQENWRNLELHALPLLVNLSALPLANRRAAQALRGVLARCRVPPEQLIAMINATELESLLSSEDSWLPILRDLGLRIGVNDVDPARLDLLRIADVDVVRLTPRTLAGLPGSPDAADQTAAIIQTAQRLGARIFASGIERSEQREALLALGCNTQQGRLLGGPQDPRMFARALVRSDTGVF